MSKPESTIYLKRELWETYLAPTSMTRTGPLAAALVITLRLRAKRRLERNRMLGCPPLPLYDCLSWSLDKAKPLSANKAAKSLFKAP